MKALRLLQLFIVLIASVSAVGQDVLRKTIPATRAAEHPKIDGDISDAVWETAPIAKDFVMFEPENGGPVAQNMQSEVRVLYDDNAIYISAKLFDRSPDSILTQLTKRDSYNENNDWFGFFINPYNDGLSDFNFWVTAAGTQADSKTTVNDDDFSLNSVWKSAVQITEWGWAVEAEIPYIALRFPETPVKDWGINFMRNVRRNRKTSTWNFLDKSSGYRFEYQCGLLTGMTNINPPVRLSTMPYLSAYADDYNGSKNYKMNAGLDLKYGINESFTLDMTLIPDFGQVAFDQQFLNLSPFENQFDENRQFFTEGTELFNIGDLLYTRRIGGEPKNIRGQDLNSNDSVSIKQEYTRLLNAVKISGRTKNNLGIGVMNAITDENFSTKVENGVEMKLLTEPLTNYNVLVLDQRFNRNSSISLVNTNTMRKGADRDANVTALLGSFISKSGKHSLDLAGKQSAIFENSSIDNGYTGWWELKDVDGLWRWEIGQWITTDNFDINDLGFQQRNNQQVQYATLLYRSIQPKGKFNRVEHELSSSYRFLQKPYRYEYFDFYYRLFGLTKSFFAAGGDVSVRPVDSYDYYEPRQFGRWFKLPPRVEGSSFISTDYRKTIALDVRVRGGYQMDFDRYFYSLHLAPRLRFGDHFFAVLQCIITDTRNDYGFVPDTLENSIFFGRRNTFSVENIIDAQYVFNPTSSLTLSLRHAYTDVDYLSFYYLEKSGDLTPYDLAGVNDLNFNTFNVDLKYSWWFAPASELVLLYRNVIANAGKTVGESYFQNLDGTLQSPMQNNISIRLTYFLDYNSTRNRLKRS